MTVATLSRDAGCRLASYIEERRRELVACVVRSPMLPRPGFFGSAAFANAFLDRLSRELKAGAGEGIDAWADSEADPASAAENARIVAVACAVVSAGYIADFGPTEEVISYLAARSADVEKRLRLEHAGSSSQAADSAKHASRDAAVASLLSAIDARDGATCEHSRAVGLWCSRVAKMLGMNSEHQAMAALAGTLHDVGKIATPSEILLKPGPLDAAEWEQMRAHPRIGAKILERIPSLKDLAAVVRGHHERMDGGGYPDGLAGAAIPLLARVVAVADAFHAMISERPYRSARPVAFALDELRAGSGTQWDPPVVLAMLSIVQPSGAHQTLRAARGAI